VADVKPVRTAASISAPAAAWIPLAHGVLGIGWWSAAAYIAVMTAAAFGIGWEVGDGGTAAALFLILAGLGGVMLSSLGAWSPLLFASLPALISAPAAYAGGALREQRSHPRITAKEAVET
jgi:hypothetical protein